MSKTEILDELPKLTKTERHEIRLRLAELDSEDWLDDEPLTAHETALLEAPCRLREGFDAGSTWEEVEGRMHRHLIVRTEAEVDFTDAAVWYVV